MSQSFEEFLREKYRQQNDLEDKDFDSWFFLMGNLRIITYAEEWKATNPSKVECEHKYIENMGKPNQRLRCDLEFAPTAKELMDDYKNYNPKFYTKLANGEYVSWDIKPWLKSICAKFTQPVHCSVVWPDKRITRDLASTAHNRAIDACIKAYNEAHKTPAEGDEGELVELLKRSLVMLKSVHHDNGGWNLKKLVKEIEQALGKRSGK